MGVGKEVFTLKKKKNNVDVGSSGVLPSLLSSLQNFRSKKHSVDKNK